uniref:Hyaluronan/mRNA-binding protein domain-containing protein n=2 Tax=Proboscia inermis TaxID=420281 RepID=A0A7S0C2G9_9STRA|mmetsp:Transcript_23133/g.23520  ORF Transcript_23133/g.23520 Transcript_23133/m.23520 type:complete len:298 (+) Transcript_23133:124-1017(+)
MNFFAALDDSGDEAPVIKKQSNKPPPNANKKDLKKTPTIAEPSTVNANRRPKHDDRNTKKGRGGRAPTRDGKRAYERRSGTGRGKEIKKGGGGARNWGSDKDAARAATSERHADSDAAVKADGDAEKSEGDAEKSEKEEQTKEEPEPEPEPEDVTISYDEYMKQKKEALAADSLAFKSLSVKEVDESSNAFKTVTASVKEETDFLVMGGGKSLRKKGLQKKSEKSVVEAGFRVGDQKSGGSDRDRRDNSGRGRRDGGGGRSGGRRDGRGGRGGGRSSGRGQRTPEINVSDPNSFPSL